MIKFKETTRIANIWKIILLMLTIICIVLYFYVSVSFLIGVVNFIIFLIIFLLLKLEVLIYEDRIEYKLFPFHKSYRIIMLDNVKKIDVLTSKSIGVLGFKIKSNLINKVYYLGGNNILRIKTRNDKIIILGTRRLLEMKQALDILDVC